MGAMKLRAHHNVIDLAEERRLRERCTAVPFVMCVPPPWFAASCAAPDEPVKPSHPAAQALSWRACCWEWASGETTRR
jgi:hypothetical protein